MASHNEVTGTRAGQPVARRGRPSAAEILGHATQAGADEALAALVHQFADPYSFLRELIQNSLDAGSTRIDVEFHHRPGAAGAKLGLATISVTDNGEGMNELVIDQHLLTLFSSTKENDLTKIGKFGIGFVSIFAIEPELVVLETGQAGESWRIIFHPDRRFEKLRLDEPVEGTTVKLHKRLDLAGFAELARRGRGTVSYWCKFAEAEIAVDGAPVSEPFGLDGALCVEHAEPGTEVVVGFPWIESRPAATADAAPGADPATGAELAPGAEPVAEGSIPLTTVLDEDGNEVVVEAAQVLAGGGELAPGGPATRAGSTGTTLVGFYNRGLTLVEGAWPPGGEADLQGLSFRIKSRYLEHTLTRDNVLQDESYDKAITIVRQQVSERLRPRLLAQMEALARHLGQTARAPEASGAELVSPEGPSYTACLSYAQLPGMSLYRSSAAAGAAILPTTDGEPLSLSQLRRLRTPVGAVLLAPRSNPLTRALKEDGVDVLVAAPGLAPWLAGPCQLKVEDANARLLVALPVALDRAAERLLAHLGQLVSELGGLRIDRLHLGDLDYPDSSVSERLHVRQRRAFGVSLRGERARLLGGARQLVLNRSHPLVRGCLELAQTDPALAALLCAQAINALEGGDALDGAALAGRTLVVQRLAPAPGQSEAADV